MLAECISRLGIKIVDSQRRPEKLLSNFCVTSAASFGLVYSPGTAKDKETGSFQGNFKRKKKKKKGSP